MEMPKSLEEMFLDFPVHHWKRVKIPVGKGGGPGVSMVIQAMNKPLCLIRSTKMLLFALKKKEHAEQ